MTLEIKTSRNFIQALIAAKRGDFKAKNILQKTSLGQNYTTNADGGYAVPQGIVEEIFTRSEASFLYDKVSKVKVNLRKNHVSYVTENGRSRAAGLGGLFSYWVGEGDEKPSSNLEFKGIDFELNKLCVVTYITDELLEDVPSFEEVWQEEVQNEIIRRIQYAIIYGSRATSMGGIAESNGTVKVTIADPITLTNLMNMVAAMSPECYTKSAWYVSAQTWLDILQAGSDEDGLVLVSDSVTPYGYLFSRPVFVLDSMYSGDILLGDASQYLMVEGNKKYNISADVEFVNDQTVLRFVLQVNGDSLWEKTRNDLDTTEVSAFVMRSFGNGSSSASGDLQ